MLKNMQITIDECKFAYARIDVQEEFAGVQVTGVEIAVDANEEEDDNYAVSVRVLWTPTGNDAHDEEIMGKFYWEKGFDKRLSEILAEHGFSAEAAASVYTSEWTLQEIGRADYFEEGVCTEVRQHMGIM